MGLLNLKPGVMGGHDLNCAWIQLRPCLFTETRIKKISFSSYVIKQEGLLFKELKKDFTEGTFFFSPWD